MFSRLNIIPSFYSFRLAVTWTVASSWLTAALESFFIWWISGLASS
jgi:hypothetical protein